MSQLQTIFEKITSRFDADKMAGLNATVQFSLTGDGGSEYYVRVQDGQCTYDQGQAEDPEATVSMTREDFESMVQGDLNPMMAFMQQKIKVDGDMSTVMKFQSLLSG